MITVGYADKEDMPVAVIVHTDQGGFCGSELSIGAARTLAQSLLLIVNQIEEDRNEPETTTEV